MADSVIEANGRLLWLSSGLIGATALVVLMMAVLLAVVLWTSALEGGVDLSPIYAVGAFVASTIRPPIDESDANYGTKITNLVEAPPFKPDLCIWGIESDHLASLGMKVIGRYVLVEDLAGGHMSNPHACPFADYPKHALGLSFGGFG